MSRLTTERHGQTTVLRLDAPDRRNALDLPTMQALVEELRVADDDDATRAIVLTGADPAFCAGLDLGAISAGELELELVEELDADPWKALQDLSTPTIAAVNGPAVTGGMELVLCCDLAVASERAALADTHARVGIVPSGGMTVLLPRYIGRRRALELSLTGRFVTAGEAHAMGLVNAVVPHDDLLATALDTAEAISSTDPAALTRIMANYRALDGMPLATALTEERALGRAAAVDAEVVAARRREVIERGRRLAGGGNESTR